MNLFEYDLYVIAFSGGKDSVSCFLHLLSLGIEPSKIELWHHCVDGNPYEEESDLMDWPCTTGYVKAFAKAFNIPIFFSWKQGGFEGEMLRENARTTPAMFETPSGIMKAGGKRGKLGTRLMFPQVSADLSVRWCSSYLKIAVAEIALNNDPRFKGIKTLFITGERAEESANRAKYNEFEPHKADLRNGRRYQRHIDQWRPVLRWPESKVWEIIEKYKVLPHPAYRLGFGRVSCATCIFGSPNQWATLQAIMEERVDRIAGYEKQFGKTIKHKVVQKEGKKQSLPFPVEEVIAKGQAYSAVQDLDLVKESLDEGWNYPIIMNDWKLPAGAYGESAGPT